MPHGESASSTLDSEIFYNIHIQFVQFEFDRARQIGETRAAGLYLIGDYGGEQAQRHQAKPQQQTFRMGIHGPEFYPATR